MGLLNSLQTKYNKALFKKEVENVRNTPQFSCNPDAKVVLLSQVYHGAVDMALLALKSFAYQLGECTVDIVDDGSLTNDDKALFQQHFSHITITHLNEIDVGKCPRGGTWERLVRILTLSKKRYVIQVDTDTLTLSAMPEIVDAIDKNIAFTIGNPIFNTPVQPSYMSLMASRWQGNHVQVETERHLSTLTSGHFQHYCRGCSALAGFPIGVLSFPQLEALSVELEQRLGKKKWYEWGSEQVASNLMISLTDSPKILPWPKYANYGFPSTGKGNREVENFLGKTTTLHFIGSHRFSSRCYEKLSKIVIDGYLKGNK